MAETHTISKGGGEAPQPTLEEQAAAMSEKRQGDTSQATSETPDDGGEDLILGKFKSQADLEAAYKELESKLGGKQEGSEDAATADDQQVDGEADGSSQGDEQPSIGEALKPFTEEFVEKGELSEESYEKLAELGYPKEVVDTYAMGSKLGQPASEDTQRAVLEELGGQEGFEELADWANKNLPKDELAKVDLALKSDVTMRYTLLGLKYAMQQSEGYEPKVQVEGRQGAQNGAVYESIEQFYADQRKPEYKTDPAFRRKVEAKLARSRV